MTESLAEKRIKMLEKAREEHTLNYVWSHDFFFGDEPDQLWRKKMCCFYCNFAQKFFIGFVFFYILTYYIYQILGNAPLTVKIHHKNTLFSSAITKEYFLLLQLLSLLYYRTSYKHKTLKYQITLLYRNDSENDQ